MKTEKKKHDPIIEFLLGSEDFRGLWFGEREEDQPFWWRKHLREYAERMAALSPAKQEQPDHTILLSKLERTFGHLDKVFTTLQEAHPHNTKALLDKVDIDFKDIQEQIKKALYDGPALPYTEENPG